MKNLKTKIASYMTLLLVVAVIVETVILNFANERQVYKTSQILLNQVESIFDNNEESEKDTLELLKAEYIVKAKAVAYMLTYNEEAIGDVEELTKIAELMSIDEIHLFDANGVIFSGTVPEYFGISFDDGEQVSFFKPMLADKNLSMCQDLTENTAEKKTMMYALTWDASGKYMVQVGIEPVRLLENLKKNSIKEVVMQMPAYDGVNIYVADTKTGEILGTTDRASEGKTLFDVGLLDENDDLTTITTKTINVEKFKNYCYYKQHGDNLIVVTNSTQANIDGFLVSIGVEIIWILIAGSVIIRTLLMLANANNKINKQLKVLESISDIYYSMHMIDMADYSVEIIDSNELMDEVIREGRNGADMLESIVSTSISDEHVEAAQRFVDLSTLGERLKNKNSISLDVIDKNVGWLRMTYITMEKDDENVPTKVIIATQIIEEDKKREEELLNQANRDELTGLFNRRAYEDDVLRYPDIPVERDFVYAAIDINGLKVVNDELGHAAGDELIRGAASCLKRTLGNYGRIYRTGGDEFVAMFFANEDRLAEIMNDLDQETIYWRGSLVPTVSLAVGYVTKKEFEDKTVIEISEIADERMYAEKNRYYSKKGVDRKGQAAAHTALCNLYTKILKINLTDDSYSIVNMDELEKTSEKGFADKISEWLRGFGLSGQVHEEDLEEYLAKTDIEYLKKYFDGDKTSISIQYRRKYADGFKQVTMEMIPANDYSSENQSLFLYVKMVDR